MTCSARHRRPECLDVRNVTAVSILRVSTKKQLEGEGHDTQRKGNNEYIARKGYTLYKEFQIAESAKDQNEDREDFTEAIAWCILHKKEIGVVVIWKVDRVSRAGPLAYFAFKQHLSQYGIRLESATEPLDESPTGEMMQTILAGFARMDNRVRTQRTISAEIALSSRGYWCRPAPTGFRNGSIIESYTPDGKAISKPILLPTEDKKQWDLLCEGLRMQMTGLYKTSAVARGLAIKGFKSREGNLMTPQTWTKICRNPVYGGLMCELWTSNKIIKAKFDGAITPDEWHELQRVLDSNGKEMLRLPRQRLNPDFPLRRFILCPHCNAPARGYSSEGKSGDRYSYYDCGNKQCNFRVKANEAHALFGAYLERLKPSKEFLNLFRAILLRDWGERHKELNRESIELQQRELDLTKEKKSIVKLMTDNAGNAAVVSAMVERLEQLDKELTFATIVATEKKIEAYDEETVINYCVYYMENVSELWQKAPVEQKYCFQSLIFPDKLPYDVLLDKRTPKLSPLYALIGELQTSESELAAPGRVELPLTD